MSAADVLASRSGRALLLVARLAFWAAAAVLAYALCRRGLTLSDEGDVLSGALAILQGKIPYRDIDMFVTPGVWYLNAAIFALTGPSVIATRIAAAGCLLATMAVVRRIVRICTSSLWGDFAAGLIAVFAVWAWPAWTWSFYSPWATLFSLAALACILEWMRSRRSFWLVVCGVLLGLAIAFKQNYGVLAAAGCLSGLLLDEAALAPSSGANWREVARRGLRAGLIIALGGALLLIPGVLWLAREGALSAAFDLLFLRPFEGFIDSHTIRFVHFGDLWRQLQIWTAGGWVYMAVPVTATSITDRWPRSAVTMTAVLHILLYWIPAFAFAGFGLRGLRGLRHGPSFTDRALLAVVVFAAAYFLGVFPRADFNHLINVYQPVLALLVAGAGALFGRRGWRRGPVRSACAVGAGLLFLCFAGVAAIWMNDLRKTVWLPLDAPRAGVLVDGFTSQVLNDEIDLVRSMTADGEPVFALPNLSMIPFLAERPMPTRYHNYYAVHIGQDAGREAAREIEDSGARVIVAASDNFFSDPGGILGYGHTLTEYLRMNFRPTRLIGSQMILVRRDHPLEYVPASDLWRLCDIRPGGFPNTFARERLLYWSLNHSFKGAWAAHNQALTTCQFKVPVDGRLRMSLELFQPSPAREPATARAEIWLFRGHGRPRRLLQHEWELASENSTFREAGQEYEVDLSRWSEEVVNLLLRTVVDGEVPPSPFDALGLTVMWNDGRLESPAFGSTTTEKTPPDRTEFEAVTASPRDSTATRLAPERGADSFSP